MRLVISILSDHGISLFRNPSVDPQPLVILHASVLTVIGLQFGEYTQQCLLQDDTQAKPGIHSHLPEPFFPPHLLRSAYTGALGLTHVSPSPGSLG